MQGKCRIVIAEDHKIIREGLKSLLAAKGHLEVVGEAEEGKDAIRRARELSPDILILDLSMPRTSGLDAISDIKHESPRTKILVLTVHKEEEYVVDAFSKGADGYMLKESGTEELITAIDMLVRGKKYISPEIAGPLIDSYAEMKRGTQKDVTAWETLSQRERQVLKLITEGFKNKQIAGHLYLSPKTVEKHRASLMKKLNVHSVAELTAVAVKKGLTGL
jgi:DNA-binding NarL/FixJ family response regulator